MKLHLKKKLVSKKITTKEPMYAVIYSRLSTVGEAKDGHRMSEQIQHCKKFAEAKGYIVEKSAIYQEISNGTGEYTKRPGLVSILNQIDKFPERKFVLIVDNTSRIARDIYTLSAYCKVLRSRNVSIESLDLPLGQTVEDQFLEDMIWIVGRYELNTSRERALQTKKSLSGAGNKDGI